MAKTENCAHVMCHMILFSVRVTLIAVGFLHVLKHKTKEGAHLHIEKLLQTNLPPKLNVLDDVSSNTQEITECQLARSKWDQCSS